MNFARRVFNLAGIYGIVVLFPQYFLEARNGADYPPAINHPEYYYGFVGVALAWQVLFLIIARDPVRYRPVMPATFIEKFSFGIATSALFVQGRVHSAMLAAGVLDMVLGALFILAWRTTAPRQAAA
jgi:hypothetical protein